MAVRIQTGCHTLDSALGNGRGVDVFRAIGPERSDVFRALGNGRGVGVFRVPRPVCDAGCAGREGSAARSCGWYSCVNHMREVDKNSWPCSYHVNIFASAWLWLSPTARCRVMLNSPSSRSTLEPQVGTRARASLARTIKVIMSPCSWPDGEHQVWRSARSGHASGRTRAGPGQDPSGTWCSCTVPYPIRNNRADP
jgi:hypothetical protein